MARRTTISAARFRSAATRWWSVRPDATGRRQHQQGAAYVFTEPGSGWTDMTRPPSSPRPMARRTTDFGTSVSISGNTVVVGAPATVGDDAQGAAYVFTEPPAANMDPDRRAHRVRWRGGRRIRLSRFRSAATRWWSERRRHVGNNSGQGAAYVFTEPGSGWADMTQTAKLTRPMARRATISALRFRSAATRWWSEPTPRSRQQPQGAAYVFTESGSGWGNRPRPPISPRPMARRATFRLLGFDQRQHGGGRGEKATVGGNSDQGAAYVFTEPLRLGEHDRRPPSSPRPTARRTTISATRFRSAATRWWSERRGHGRRQRRQGAAYVFTLPAPVGRHDPDHRARRVRWRGERRFRHLGFHQRQHAGGRSRRRSPTATKGRPTSSRTGSGWSNMTTAELTASDGKAGDSFGASVSISGNTLVVGARSVPTAARGRPTCSPSLAPVGTSMTQTANLTASNGAAGDLSAVRSPSAATQWWWSGHGVANSDQGAAYVFVGGRHGLGNDEPDRQVTARVRGARR